jgi:hypothetical protein
VLALSGALLRSGLQLDLVRQIVGTAATAAGYQHFKQASIDDTAKKLDKDEPATGWPKLAQVLPREVVDQLWKWLGKPSRQEAGAEGNSGAYTVSRGCICFIKRTPETTVLVPLSNFNARIAAEVSTDDGRETTREFEIEGILDSGLSLPTVRVAVGKFAAMNWPIEQWGHRAAVAAGMNSKDRLREALQRLSKDVGERRIYAHTGGPGLEARGCISMPAARWVPGAWKWPCRRN